MHSKALTDQMRPTIRERVHTPTFAISLYAIPNETKRLFIITLAINARNQVRTASKPKRNQGKPGDRQDKPGIQDNRTKN